MNKRKRRMVERAKRREYSSAYLKKIDSRKIRKNQYPWSRIVLIRDFFRTPDFYKAIFFFLSIQAMLSIIGIGMKNPDMAGLLNIIAIVIGFLLVIMATREINKRQRQDNTRRKFSMLRMLLRAVAILIVVVGFNVTAQSIGIQPKMQPNQVPLDTLYTVFPIATIFAIVIVAPIIEELVFRELLPYASGPSYISFIMSSILFIILHSPSGMTGWLNYAILSSMLLYARLKDNNVYSSVGIHSSWNLVTVLM